MSASTKWRPLFVDLDGVLADFEKRVREIFGRDFPRSPEPVGPAWKVLANYSKEGGTPDFFATLDLMPDALELWTGVEKLNPVILTGMPLGPWPESQKRAWCSRHLGPSIPVITCMKAEKANRAIHWVKDRNGSCSGTLQSKTAGNYSNNKNKNKNHNNNNYNNNNASETPNNDSANKTTTTTTTTSSAVTSPSPSPPPRPGSYASALVVGKGGGGAGASSSSSSSSSAAAAATTTATTTATATTATLIGAGSSTTQSSSSLSSISSATTDTNKSSSKEYDGIGVLIDDSAHAREAWEAAGGIFVHHTSASDTLRQLRELGYL